MVSLTSKYQPKRVVDFAGLKLAKALMGKLAAQPWESAWFFCGQRNGQNDARAGSGGTDRRRHEEARKALPVPLPCSAPPIAGDCQRFTGRPAGWPNWQKCLDGAPESQSRPGQNRESMADFTWCIIAIRWGHSTEATAEKLLDISPNWLLPLLPKCHHYCEPFAGSAAVLLNREPSPVETYNDIDGEVANFFRVLRDHKGALVEKIGLTPFSREEFYYSVSKNPARVVDVVERARCSLQPVERGSAMKGRKDRDRYGEPISRLAWLRKQPKMPLDLPVECPYDPRRHPFVTHISRKDGSGMAEVDRGPIVYFDVTADIAAGLRNSRGEWTGGDQ